MKKKNNNSMMRDGMLSIMTLDFFSKRFNIHKELLSWGIQKLTIEERTSYVPVVMIENSQVFIDIKKDCFSSRNSVFGRTAVLLPAEMEETKEAYKFSATNEGAQYVLTKDDLRSFYERKLMF